MGHHEHFSSQLDGSPQRIHHAEPISFLERVYRPMFELVANPTEFKKFSAVVRWVLISMFAAFAGTAFLPSLFH